GRAPIVGTALGVLIFQTLSNVFTLNDLSSSAQAVARGVIIVLAVLLQMRLADRDPRAKNGKAAAGPAGGGRVARPAAGGRGGPVCPARGPSRLGRPPDLTRARPRRVRRSAPPAG